jgi:hypothetical protein
MKTLFPILVIVIVLTWGSATPTSPLHNHIINVTPDWIVYPCGYKNGKCVVHPFICPKDLKWLN